MRNDVAFGVILVGALAASLPALADDQTDPYALGTIVVTGTRQERNLLAQAGNTSVIDIGRIDATMPQRPEEILNQIPGMGIQQGGGEEEITAIRSPALNGGRDRVRSCFSKTAYRCGRPASAM